LVSFLEALPTRQDFKCVILLQMENRLKVVNLHLHVSEKDEKVSNEQSLEIITKLDQRNNLISQTLRGEEAQTTEYIKVN